MTNERTIYKVIKNNEVVLETTNQEEAVLFYVDVSGDSIELQIERTNKMTKQEFMAKHNLNEQDYRNLKRYEQLGASGEMNMFEHLGMMKAHNLNGRSKLANWILTGTNYAEFMEVLENERNK